MPNKKRVSAAELVRNFGYWQEQAIGEPVFVTHHRRDRLVLLSVEQFNGATASNPAATGSNQKPSATHQDLSTEFAVLLENIADAYLLLGPELQILQVNSRLEALWKVSRDQLIGRNFHDFIPVQKATILSQRIKRVLITRQPESAEFASQVFPGVHLSTRIYPHPRGVLLMHSNITELANLRLQHAEAESLKGAIDRHPQIAHAQIDSKGRFTYSDETIQVWTGFDAETLASTRISDVCAPEDRRRVMEAVEDVIGAHVPSAITARFIGRNFSEYEVLLTLAPIMTDQNATALTVIAAMTKRTADTPALGET